MATDSFARQTALLHRWASIGAQLAASQSRPEPSWDAVTRMIDSARPKLIADAQKLRELLERSRKLLAPLEEPFDLDLGLHRWLDAEREEAYSDWLAWVVRQAETPTRVYGLFGLEAPPDDSLKGLAINVEREYWIPYEHIDQEGRLDVVIRYGRQAIIVVEVKTTDAEASEYEKNKEYKKWLDKQHYQHKNAVFLAVSGQEGDFVHEEEDNAGNGEVEPRYWFDFRSWAEVCIQMRFLAREVLKEQPPRLMVAAMILAFVAAVEQNLLGFTAALVRDVCKGLAVFFNPAVVQHVTDFLAREE